MPKRILSWFKTRWGSSTVAGCVTYFVGLFFKFVGTAALPAAIIGVVGGLLVDSLQSYQTCKSVLHTTRIDVHVMRKSEELRRQEWNSEFRTRFVEVPHDGKTPRPWLMPEAQGFLLLDVYRANLPNLGLVSERVREEIVHFYLSTYHLEATIRQAYGPNAIFGGKPDKEWLANELERRERAWDAVGASLETAISESKCHWP